MTRSELDQALFDDLLDLYYRSGAEVTYVLPSGRVGPYWPRRYLQMIKRHHLQWNPSRIIEATEKLVNKPSTVGFGIIEDADRLDLSVEVIVVDKARPYHHLFSREAVEAAHARIDAYLARRAGRHVGSDGST